MSTSRTTTSINTAANFSSLSLRSESPPRSRNKTPLRYGGSLDQYESFEVTPAVGREFKDLRLSSLLDSPHSEDLIRDLAIIVSRRGVCFFRDQDLTAQQMAVLAARIGQLSGKPSNSSLHVHPLTEESSELGDQIAVISSEKQAKGGGLRQVHDDRSLFSTNAWHSDITFEPIPSDYAMLKIHTLPATGGDTLWNSMYEAYDRLSPAMAGWLETLTATHDANFFADEARRLGIKMRTGERGSPFNQGDNLQAVHPVIRTNPVTGWKGLFINKAFTKRINNVTKDESDYLLNYLHALCHNNFDMQLRFKWTKNAVAIWDNRSTQHSATYDYVEARAGDRACSVGEKPYLDVTTTGRREALAQEAE
ncbi:hypothetical protein QFC21_003279 [Naganishia friedmannii]|uniref:Uncharacterized protein n=1 Tax=Naganishia friedmannii TaxID=89922 RepID=A0ACC2VPL0_9TREE|nr:hypothetical protein QFC21_003279 [Naganishia friedmannii]